MELFFDQDGRKYDVTDFDYFDAKLYLTALGWDENRLKELQNDDVIMVAQLTQLTLKRAYWKMKSINA